MKKIVAYLLSPVLYLLGDAISRVMHLANWLGWLYWPYNKLMCASADIEEWAGVEIIWRTPSN